MSKSSVPSQSPIARLARWLGFDRNPLRRPCDRFEAAVRLLAVIGVLVAMVAGIMLGIREYEKGLRVEAEQQRARHEVSATLIEDVAMARFSPAGAPVGQAKARWTAPNGTVWQDTVTVAPTKRAGDTVRLWVDERGAPTTRPQDRDATVVRAVTVGGGIPVLAAAVLGTLTVSVRAINQRRARRMWEAQWTIVEPMWRINGR